MAHTVFAGEGGAGVAKERRARFRAAADRLLEAAAVVAERGAVLSRLSVADWCREITLTILAGDALVACGLLDIAEIDAVLLLRLGAASGSVAHAVVTAEDARVFLDAGVARCAAPPIGESIYDKSLRPARDAAASAMAGAAVLVLDWLNVRLLTRGVGQRATVAASLGAQRSVASAEDAVGNRLLKRSRLSAMSPDPAVAIAAAESLICEARAALATARARRVASERLRLRLEAKRVAGRVPVRRGLIDNGPVLPDLLGLEVSNES